MIKHSPLASCASNSTLQRVLQLSMFKNPVTPASRNFRRSHLLGGSLLLPESSSTVRRVVSTMSCALLCILRTIFLAVCTNLVENAGKSCEPSPSPCEPGQYFGGPLRVCTRPEHQTASGIVRGHWSGGWIRPQS